MNVSVEPRRVARKDYPVPHRLDAIDGDLDSLMAQVMALSNRIDTLIKVVGGFFLTLLSTTIALTLNLLVK